MTSDYDRAALHPDDLKERVPARQRVYEAAEPAHVVADQVYEVAYKQLIEELRFNLRSKEDEPVPVYGFGFDWRQPLEVAQQELAAFIDEVIRRTALLRHYHRDGYTEKSKVSLVGHSMGGLVIAGYLAKTGAAHRVDKIVSLGSPFQGSFEAIVKVTTGNANLGADPPSSREREAARMTPGLYHLVPSFADGLTVDPPFPSDLFNPDAWQPSIVETIAEYVRLRGREKLTVPERRAMAAQILAAMLAAAKSHRNGLDKLDLNAIGLKGAWLCVIGVDSVTRVHLRVVKAGQKPEFAFRLADRVNRWSDPVAENRRETGDGTVPFAGALPKFLPYESLVCVSPDDFDTWVEIGDRALMKAAGFHGMLPNMNMLHRLIVRFLTGKPDTRKNTWGRPAPGVTSWKPPLPLDPV